MNIESNAQQITAAFKEQWILQGIPPIGFGTSNVGLNEDFLRNPPEAEELGKVIKIFDQREPKTHQLVTSVIGEENFKNFKSRLQARISW